MRDSFSAISSANKSENEIISKMVEGMIKLDNKMILRRIELESQKLKALRSEVDAVTSPEELRELLLVESHNWVLQGQRDGYSSRANEIRDANPDCL